LNYFSFKREVGVCNQHGQYEACYGYGIASVFTPPENRGNGYAGHMMRLLHWVLAPSQCLPKPFPSEWGLPPPRVADAGDARVSVLWSDIGPEFYARNGPAPEYKGWVPRGEVSTIWRVHELQIDEGKKLEEWEHLDAEGVLKLWEDEKEKITSEMRNKLGSEEAAFTFYPGKGIEQFQRARRLAQLKRLNFPLVETWGLRSKLTSSFVAWTIELEPTTLLLTHMRISTSAELRDALAVMKNIAAATSVKNIEAWGLEQQLIETSDDTRGVTAVRTEHIPAFAWYGPEEPESVKWLNNER
jgi:hypothetical protein